MMRALGMLRLSDSLAKHTRTDPPLGPDLGNPDLCCSRDTRSGDAPLVGFLGQAHTNGPSVGARSGEPDLENRKTMLQGCAIWG